MPTKVLIAGSTGTIGSQLVPFLHELGYEVFCLQRTDPQKLYYWDIERGLIQDSLEGFDAVINLVGYPVATGRWNTEIKEKIWNSRIVSTQLLVNHFKVLQNPPKTFLCASAVGYYGHVFDQKITEDHAAGSGFLADVCQAWEKEANKAKSLGIRVVNLRFGIVLTPRGGILKTMVTLFRLYLGGKLGSGNQWMSWIGIDDLLALIQLALTDNAISGPLNFVSPSPVTNKDFTKALATALHRPAFLPASEPILRFLLAEMAEETLLASTHAYPAKALQHGYHFRHTNLQDLLQAFFNKQK